MSSILFALWFFLPAGLANAGPVLVRNLPFLKKFDTPLDFGKTFRGKRIFGQNKTWRGLLSGIVIAVLTLALQRYLFLHFNWFRDISQSVDYATINYWLLGILFGAGALLGDAIESSLKRQADVPPGEAWFPFDQTDYIIGGLLASWWIIQLSPKEYLLIFLIWFALHIIASYIGFLLGLKNKPI